MKIREIFQPNFYKQQQKAQAKSRALQRSSKVSGQVVDYALQAYKDQLAKETTGRNLDPFTVPGDRVKAKNLLKKFAADYFFSGKDYDQVNNEIMNLRKWDDNTLKSLLFKLNVFRLDKQAERQMPGYTRQPVAQTPATPAQPIAPTQTVQPTFAQNAANIRKQKQAAAAQVAQTQLGRAPRKLPLPAQAPTQAQPAQAPTQSAAPTKGEPISIGGQRIQPGSDLYNTIMNRMKKLKPPTKVTEKKARA